jgi:hypothetical protein
MFKLTVEFETLAELKTFLYPQAATTTKVTVEAPPAPAPTKAAPPAEVPSNGVPKNVKKAEKSLADEIKAKKQELANAPDEPLPKLAVPPNGIAEIKDNAELIKQVCSTYGIEKLAQLKPEHFDAVKKLILALE